MSFCTYVKKSVRDAVRTYISHAEFAELRKDYAGHNLDKIDYAETYFASLVCSIRTVFLLNSLPSVQSKLCVTLRPLREKYNTA